VKIAKNGKIWFVYIDIYPVIFCYLFLFLIVWNDCQSHAVNFIAPLLACGNNGACGKCSGNQMLIVVFLTGGREFDDLFNYK
jgi:hypothetical protein